MLSITIFLIIVAFYSARHLRLIRDCCAFAPPSPWVGAPLYVEWPGSTIRPSCGLIPSTYGLFSPLILVVLFPLPGPSTGI